MPAIQANYSTDGTSSALQSNANNDFKQILNVLSGAVVGSGKKDRAETTGEMDSEQLAHKSAGKSLSDEEICDVLQAACAGQLPIEQIAQLLALDSSLSTGQMLHEIPANQGPSGISPEAMALLAQLLLQSNGDSGAEQMTAVQAGFEKPIAQTSADTSLAAAMRNLSQTDITILNTIASRAAEIMQSKTLPDSITGPVLRGYEANAAGSKTGSQYNGIPLSQLTARWQELFVPNNLTRVSVKQAGEPANTAVSGLTTQGNAMTSNMETKQNTTVSGLTTACLNSDDYAIALAKANRPVQGTVLNNNSKNMLAMNTTAFTVSDIEAEANKGAAVVQSGSAMQTGTKNALPLSIQTLILGGPGQQTYAANTPTANALSGETSKDTGGNSQQLDGAQMAMNITSSSTAGTAKAAGGEMPALLKSSDNALFMQLADAVRGQVSKDGQGQTQVRLQLHPANLGEVSIKLTYRDGNITTHFHAATEQARQAIENCLPQLREVLAGHQLNLQSATVSAGDEGSRWGQRENQGQQYSKKRGANITKSGQVTETITGTSPEAMLTGDANRLNSFA
ncbi:flagellar hook-length control protein FliK [Desulfoscipio sp. XC116]|uniref:flagellar hook-length control protein FliK n=1 Tax=Desulfoscipio sp. XC116 TaxID=3144975 RepID=UPI00325B5B83